MNDKQMDALFDLLQTYFPNAKKPRDPKVREAWGYVLQPYRASEVKAAVVQCVREKNFFPDVTDITQKCSVPVFTFPMGEADRRAREDWERMRAFLKQQREEEGAHEQ